MKDKDDAQRMYIPSYKDWRRRNEGMGLHHLDSVDRDDFLEDLKHDVSSKGVLLLLMLSLVGGMISIGVTLGTIYVAALIIKSVFM